MFLWICAIAAGALGWFAPLWFLPSDSDLMFVRICSAGVAGMTAVMIILMFDDAIDRAFRKVWPWRARRDIDSSRVADRAEKQKGR